MDASKHRGLMGFWMEWGWIGDVSNLTYSKHKGVGNFCEKWGSFWFRGVFGVVPNIGGVSRIMGWPSANTNTFLVTNRDLEFGVGDEGVKSFIPPDKEPGVIDEFKGEVSLGGGVDLVESLF
jgi:hypothetical protein